MLEDMSQHVLDIAENSIRAGASVVKIVIKENVLRDTFIMTVEDNGCGMDDDSCRRALDPFHTTKKVRKVGLGLPFLKQLSELCGGDFSIDSKVGYGTKVQVSFVYSCIDRPPLGDVASTMMALLLEAPDVSFVYTHYYNEKLFVFDTAELVTILGDDLSFSNPSVALWIRDYIKENLNVIRSS